MTVDETGIDETVVDKTGVDELGILHRVFSRDVVLGGKLLLWGEKM